MIPWEMNAFLKTLSKEKRASVEKYKSELNNTFKDIILAFGKFSFHGIPKELTLNNGIKKTLSQIIYDKHDVSKIKILKLIYYLRIKSINDNCRKIY